jgi:hypothetical protein
MRIASKVLCTGALVIFGTAAYADAQTSAKIRGCIMNSGSLRVLAGNESCRANETAIEWNVAGPMGPQGPQGPDGPPGTGTGSVGVRVVNALGEDLGPVLDSTTVVMTLPTGRKVLAQLFAAGPPANWAVAQYYQSNNCSGEAYVSWMSMEELLPPALVRKNGVWAIRPGSIAQRTVGSMRVYDDNGAGACRLTSGAYALSAFDFYSPVELKLSYPLQVQ